MHYEKLFERYRVWMQACRLAGISDFNDPVRDGARLYFRQGYPNPGWGAWVIESSEQGYELVDVQTEHRTNPDELWEVVFSRFEDAEKFVIYEIAETLRVKLRLTPITQIWRSEGLHPGVVIDNVNADQSKYAIANNPAAYFIRRAGGVSPLNRLLPLEIGELEVILCSDMPDHIARTILP